RVHRRPRRLRDQCDRRTALSVVAVHPDVSPRPQLRRVGPGRCDRGHHHGLVPGVRLAIRASRAHDRQDPPMTALFAPPRRSAGHLARVSRRGVVPLALITVALVVVGVPVLMAVAWSLVDPANPWSYPDV